MFEKPSAASSLLASTSYLRGGRHATCHTAPRARGGGPRTRAASRTSSRPQCFRRTRPSRRRTPTGAAQPTLQAVHFARALTHTSHRALDGAGPAYHWLCQSGAMASGSHLEFDRPAVLIWLRWKRHAARQQTGQYSESDVEGARALWARHVGDADNWCPDSKIYHLLVATLVATVVLAQTRCCPRRWLRHHEKPQCEERTSS